MKDKAYRQSPIGGEVGRFLRALRWSDKATNTLLAYELCLSRLSVDFAHIELADLSTEMVRGFLDEHWGESSPLTRRARLAAVNSFLGWAVTEGRLEKNPAGPIKPPRAKTNERHAYPAETIEKMRRAQPDLQDQVCVQLVARLGLRKNELRLLRVSDFDLTRGTVLVHGKGGKDVLLPLGFDDLKTDLHLHLLGRLPGEYLLYPKKDKFRPLDSSSVHRRFKQWLQRAELPATVKLHEMRHSAAQELWRQSKDIVLVKELLRHENIATTLAYLHPTRDDLAAALAAMTEVER